MYRQYALGVISELQQLGYPGEEAKTVFLRHYRGMKRAVKRKYNPDDPDSIYIGHQRDRLKRSESERSENMVALTDSEKVDLLIALLEAHLEKMQTENTLSNYLESLTSFLKSRDQILQKAAVSNSSLFFDNLHHDFSNLITSIQAIGALVAAFDKVGYPEAIDASAIILQYVENIREMSSQDMEKVYKERWDTDMYRG
jgi:hypothetical protein